MRVFIERIKNEKEISREHKLENKKPKDAKSCLQGYFKQQLHFLEICAIFLIGSDTNFDNMTKTLN
jgi:hypothetical protein